jgi:hypothetical protein
MGRYSRELVTALAHEYQVTGDGTCPARWASALARACATPRPPLPAPQSSSGELGGGLKFAPKSISETTKPTSLSYEV